MAQEMECKRVTATTAEGDEPPPLANLSRPLKIGLAAAIGGVGGLAYGMSGRGGR